MDPADNFNDLPSVPTSFLHQPHEPIFTFDQTSPLLATDAAVPEAPPTDLASTDWPSAPSVFEPLPWITSIISHRSYMPYLTTTSSPSPSPTNAVPNSTSKIPKAPDATQTQQAVVSKGAQIGIFVGIAVVVILGVIGCCLGILDLRRRYKRRKERRTNRDAELTVLENEVQNGRAGHKDQKRDGKHGLWDKLKVDTSIQHREEAPSSQRSDREASAGLWERIGETRHHEKEIIGRKSSTTSSERTDGEVEWLPAYVPRERVSIVSSVGSLTSSANGRPIMPRSFIGEESRR